MKVYKIRHKKTGLFSTGGRYAEWKKKGKIWNSKGDAQKAIDWHTRDEKAYHVYTLEEYKKECAHVEKHNAEPHNVKSNNMWPMPVKSRVRFISFYKDAEIIEFTLEE